MKKKKSNKRRKLAVLIVGLTIGLITLLYNNHQKEFNKITAHPTNILKLDDGLTSEYSVKTDAIQLLEPKLRNQSPLFDDYLQGEEVSPFIEKLHIEGLGSPNVLNKFGVSVPIVWTVVGIEKTLSGNFAVLFSPGGVDAGGVVKFSVYNKDGKELATEMFGSMNDAVLRLGSGFYATKDNSYLAYMSGNGRQSTYVRFDVNESNPNNILITNTRFNSFDKNIQPILPGETDAGSSSAIRSHGIRQVIGGVGGTTGNATQLVTGDVYFSSPSVRNDGTVKGRVPIGEVSVKGWESATSGAYVNTMRTKYLHSLETDNPDSTPGANWTDIKNMYVSPTIGVTSSGYYYGRVDYNSFIAPASNYKYYATFQIFDKTGSGPIQSDGQQLRKKIYSYRDPANVVTTTTDPYKILLLSELTTATKVYFLSNEATGTKLIEVDINNGNPIENVLQVFPKNTVIKISEGTSGDFAFYGTTTDIGSSSAFYSSFYSQHLNSPYYYVQGIMKKTPGSGGAADKFEVVSVKALEIDNIVNPKFIVNVDMPANEKDRFFIGGDTLDHSNFVDHYQYYDSNFAKGPMATPPTEKHMAAFAGVLAVEDDYAPALTGFEDIMVNIKDSSLNQPGVNAYNWTLMDNWLITGTKNGSLGDSKAIKFTDVKDYENTLIAPTLADRQKYVGMRINRNINNLSADIDWKTLGFDKTYPGPQLVTYFTNDSQNQQTVISRWINKITDRTIIDKDHYLDVHDFTYKLSDVADLSDKELVKKLSRVIAWYVVEETNNGVTKKIAYEDENTLTSPPTFDHTNVVFDTAQLNDILNAKKAAPYPLDYTYTGTDEKGNKVELKNRVTVFLTDYTFDDETGHEYDPDRKLAVYADDYSLPLYVAKDETKQKIFDNSNIKVYEFDKNRNSEVDGNGDPITITLADKTKLASGDTLEPVSSYKTALNTANYPGKLDMHVYFKGKNSKGEEVDITSKFVITLIPEVLLHLRQVVLTPHSEIVVPTEGYHGIDNVKLADTSQKADLHYQTITKSAIESANPAFKTIIVPFEFDYTEPDLTKQYGGITIKPVIPEYYQYDGHVLTYTNIKHQSTSKNNSDVLWPIIDDKDHHEAWVTIYLKPTLAAADHARPYSWDYQNNEFNTVVKP
ncbi:hypothetical protein I6N95_26770 [Vagococcus sp. BWB3-3]|uniref:Uncharacterized protein n=1 Tax=Vagococcus allomyrinae TaxID=2794353 RepID=A0A940PGW0_9ENTE|nr:hypothetical protein [Vagococcus allomyrinae]MBP1044619.1 hypothetical protein [Vagococcus allomyrinae]